MALVSAVWDKLLGSVSAPVRPSVSQGNGLRLESAPYHVPLRNLSRCRAQNSVGTSSSPSDSCLTWRTPVTRLPQPLVPTCQWSAAGELGLLRHPPHAAGVSADVVPGTQSSPAATGVRIGRTQGRHMGPMTAPVRTVRSAELLPQERELLQTSGVIVAALLRKERLVTVPEAGGQHDQPVLRGIAHGARDGGCLGRGASGAQETSPGGTARRLREREATRKFKCHSTA